MHLDKRAAETIYISPTGKRCMFVPSGTSGWAYFRYMDETERNGDGFPLSWANFFAIMRPHARQSHARR